PRSLHSGHRHSKKQRGVSVPSRAESPHETEGVRLFAPAAEGRRLTTAAEPIKSWADGPPRSSRVSTSARSGNAARTPGGLYPLQRRLYVSRLTLGERGPLNSASRHTFVR